MAGRGNNFQPGSARVSRWCGPSKRIVRHRSPDNYAVEVSTELY